MAAILVSPEIFSQRETLILQILLEIYSFLVIYIYLTINNVIQM